MLKNYLKIAFRSLWRHKAFTILNMTGLAIGMSAFFLIAQYVRFEHSYDDFVTKKGRIYRLVTDLKSSAATLHWSSTSMPMAINIKAEYPEVENIVRFHRQNVLLRRGDIKFEENETVFADSSLFAIFSFPLLEGDPASALKEPFSVILSQSTAKKYFGDANPIGQTMQFTDSGYNAKVTGVMKDLPENSTIKADLFVSMSTRKRFRDSLDYHWGNFGERSYLLLKPGASAAGLEAKLPSFMNRHLGPTFKAQQEEYVLFLEPLKATYWSERGGFVNGSRSNAILFSIIGIFILLIACINFVNLTTARSAERAKEVGIRKVIGAVRFQLTGQFLGESIVISLLAFLLAVGLCIALSPQFNQLAGKIVSTGVIDQPASLLTLLVIALLIGLLAGIYPALVLSSFKPIASLKGRFASGTRGLFLRRSLVVFQFTVSIVLIIGTAVVYSQLNYMRSRDLGFSKDQTLVIDTENDPHKVAFRQEVAAVPNVQSISFSGTVPGQGTWSAYSRLENSRGEMQAADIDLTYVDFGYLEQYKMRLLAGRFFDKNIVTDTMQAMIINEAALKLFGYLTPQSALGRRFEQWGKKGVIIGVIKNYNFEGLQQEIHPLSILGQVKQKNGRPNSAFRGLNLTTWDLSLLAGRPF